MACINWIDISGATPVYISPSIRLHIFRERSSVLEGFEQLPGAAGWMPLQTMSPAWEDVGMLFCFVLPWRTNEAVLVTVNDNGKTRANIRQTK